MGRRMSAGAAPNTLGSVVRLARAASGLTIRELARRADLSPGYLSDVEHGNRIPAENAMERLAVALELHPAFLAATAGRITTAVSNLLRANPEIGAEIARWAEEEASQ